MHKKNILIVGPTPPPLHGVTFKTQRLISSRRLSSFFNVRFLPLAFSKHIEEIGRFHWKKLWIFFSTWIALVKELLLYQINALYYPVSVSYIGLARDLTYIATAALFRTRIILCFDGKGLLRIYHSCSYICQAIMKSILSRADIGIILSRRLAFDVEPFVRLNNLRVIPNGVEDLQHEYSKRLNRDERDNKVVNVLFLSTIMGAKGVFTFLEAITLIVEKFDDVVFVFAGNFYDSAERAKFWDFISGNGIAKHVKYVGPVYGEDKFWVFEQADIFVFPTHWETFGIVNIEAMSMELPVISTNVGGIPDIVEDGISGYLVEPQDPNSLGEKILVLLRDREKRISMGQAGRARYLEKFTIEKWETQMIETFRDVVESPDKRVK